MLLLSSNSWSRKNLFQVKNYVSCVIKISIYGPVITAEICDEDLAKEFDQEPSKIVLYVS